MNEASHGGAPLVELRAVGKTYRDGNVVALDHVDLQIECGEFLSVTGPSGCGKSTLLHMLGALDRPTCGEIFYSGRTLSGLNVDELRTREIGFVFQSFYLLPNLTAEENVQLPMFGGDLSLVERRTEARRLLELVGLQERVSHLPNQLSIGQRQRVAIARALANRPQMILADEPTGSLDSRSGLEVMELLSRLNAEEATALVVVTHDANVAAMAQRRISMLDGRIQHSESPQSADSPCDSTTEA